MTVGGYPAVKQDPQNRRDPHLVNGMRPAFGSNRPTVIDRRYNWRGLQLLLPVADVLWQ